ncbi:YciI family protein [Desulfopila aestuarii]|uniref:YCII-related domain-containing protein n=1 Tax=Desulfopila aestuarii DSM 18488 TaxID=1121416 RepID=A0A1M7Y3T2_9BACT|nr:YciI family protein [Desulfopila aestuarii]SHO46823.1 YCII-related domain-containing protein [Desulfopila aestuarii DSM 18488]
MPYIIYAIDKEGQDILREEIRDEHRKHLGSLGPKLLYSGALLDEDNQTIIGGVSVVDVENIGEAEAFANNDPYSKYGIRKEVRIEKWRIRWVKGKFMSDA